MPHESFRFCPTCVTSEHPAGQESCPVCGARLLPLLDGYGAVSSAFLTARSSCCGNGCRNCPYDSDDAEASHTTPALQKTCERCGSGFECRSGNCWCEGVRLSPDAVKRLQRDYTDCLCPSCLAGYACSPAVK